MNERSQDGDLSTARGILLRVTGGWGVGGGGDCLEINIIQSFHKKEKNMEPILHKALGYGKIIFEAFFLTHSYVSFIRG